jgi:hypothetical protein
VSCDLGVMVLRNDSTPQIRVIGHIDTIAIEYQADFLSRRLPSPGSKNWTGGLL